jgi:hypothetical protein
MSPDSDTQVCLYVHAGERSTNGAGSRGRWDAEIWEGIDEVVKPHLHYVVLMKKLSSNTDLYNYLLSLGDLLADLRRDRGRDSALSSLANLALLCAGCTASGPVGRRAPGSACQCAAEGSNRRPTD